MEETKIIYHIDDEDTPYLIKLPIHADRVTLGDFKNALNRPNYKYFFKSMDDDFGVVKEEIIDDEAHLPCFNGRVISWLVPAESSVSDTQSQCTESQAGDTVPPLPSERVGGIGDSRPPSFHANASSRDLDPCDTCTETESVVSSRRDHHHSGQRSSHHHSSSRGRASYGPRLNGHSKHDRHRSDRHFDGTSSVMSSDIETTSFFDSEDDASSRFSTITDTTSRSSKYGRHRRRKRRHRMPPISRASSFSSITDSTMSLNIITVTLNMDTVNFLGISIVGQSNKGGDGGIYVGSIMKGGAVAQDGRIEPGDMILEVNGISFENMSNDDAVRTLREAVQKPSSSDPFQCSPVTLVVAKCWDPNPKGYFTIPRQEPVRPIDPSAWVAHTTALRGDYPGGHRPGGMGSPSISTMTSTSSSLTSSIPESEVLLLNRANSMATRTSTSPSFTSSLLDSSEGFEDKPHLTVNTDMATIVKAMAQPDSGLEIRDRMWLKITIPNAFIGSDLVDWLHTHVEGFADRRDARKYACNLLKANFIRHTVNKITFSEQCYYVFGDLCGTADDWNGYPRTGAEYLPYTMMPNMSSLSLEDVDSVSEAERDTLAPLPPPAWNNYTYGPPYMPPPPPGGYMPPPPPGGYIPPAPYGYSNDTGSYVSLPITGEVGNNGSAGSVHSGSDCSSRSSKSSASRCSERSSSNKSVKIQKSKAKKDKSCACIVSHTYKQIRKLWEIKDKANLMNGVQRFDDIERSTSSCSVAFTELTTTQKNYCLAACMPLRKSTKSSSSKSHSYGAANSAHGGKNEPNNNLTGEVTRYNNYSTSSSEGSSASGSSGRHKDKDHKSPGGSGSDTETASVISSRRAPLSENLPPPPPVQLSSIQQDMAASRGSFRMAMGNSYFDDPKMETLQVMGDL